MNAIISEIKETIALKRKEMEQGQGEVNSIAYDLHNRVTNIYHLKHQVEILESELSSLQKSLGIVVGMTPSCNEKNIENPK